MALLWGPYPSYAHPAFCFDPGRHCAPLTMADDDADMEVEKGEGPRFVVKKWCAGVPHCMALMLCRAALACRHVGGRPTLTLPHG